MASFLSVRVSQELKAALRSGAAERGWNESQFVQFLLATALGESPENAARDAVLRGVQAQLRARLGAVTAGVRQLLDEQLVAPFRSEGEPFSPEVSPEPDEGDEPEDDVEDVPPTGTSGVSRRRRGR